TSADNDITTPITRTRPTRVNAYQAPSSATNTDGIIRSTYRGKKTTITTIPTTTRSAKGIAVHAASRRRTSGARRNVSTVDPEANGRDTPGEPRARKQLG